MMKAIFIYLLLAFISLNIHAQQKLSEHSQISVLTCSQGDELYSAFGHSALRVYDPIIGIDWVYNYGTFDFNTPNFYLKFANGQLNYMLSIGEFKRFLPEYFKDKRSVTEQVLNLDLEDRQSIFNALMLNYRPENRNYKYDFFYDNCATRILDIVGDNIKGELVLNENTDEPKSLSFRTYLHHYLANSPWIETGLNLLLGMPADKIASLSESTYLPDFLMDVFSNANINKGDGSKVKIVQTQKVLLEADLANQGKTFFTPSLIFWCLLGVIVVLAFVLKGNTLLFIDRILFFTVGCIGILISYLWLVTDHSVTGNNLNILWALPFFLYFAFSKYKSKFSKYLVYFSLTSILVFLVGWKLIGQSFPAATIPIALLLGFRLFTNYNLKTKNV